MAVARVFGQVDGVEIILEPKEGNRWEVPVPFDEDGEYVVEILAEDEAGNRAYMAKMLFVVNTAQLCAHIIPLPFYGELMTNQGCIATLDIPVRNITILDYFKVSVETRGYCGEVVLPECIGGRGL